MTDVARLGFAADTTDLTAAQKQLAKLSVEAGKAEVAAAKLAKAQTSAALAAARAANAEASAAATIASASKTMSAAEKQAAADNVKMAAASMKAAQAADLQAAASMKAAQAALQQSQAAQNLVQSNQAAADSAQNLAHANDNAMRLMGRTAGVQQANMTNIAAQFQDIGVTAAMGMNPLMIGLQQGAQLTGVWGSIAGTTSEKMKTFGASLSAVLSPMSLVIIGITAAIAALVQFVDWGDLAKSALGALANGLEVAAPYAFAAGAAMTLAFGPTILGMIWSVTSAIVTGVVPAIWSGVVALNAFAAANPFTFFILTLATTLTAIYMFRDDFKRIFGFDIIKTVKDVAEFIIDAFGAAFDTVKMLWNKLTSLDMDFSIVDTFMASFGARQRSSAIDAGVEWGKNFVSGVAGSIRGLAGSIGAAAPKSVKVPSAGSGGASAATSAAKPEISDMEKFYKEYSDSMRQGTQDLQIEIGTLRMGEKAAAAYRFEQELINDANAKGIPLDRAKIDALIKEKNAQYDMTEALRKHRDAIEFDRDATRGFLSDMKSGLMQGKSVWETWGNAVLNVLNKIVDKLLNDVVDAMFKVNSASGGGGILSGISSILGIGGPSAATVASLTPSASATIAANPSLFAKGGAFTNSIVSQPTQFFAKGGAPGVMGEAGPEAVMPLQRGPDGSLGVQMYGGTGSGAAAPAVVHVVPSPYFDVVVDDRAAKVASPMVVQGSMAATKVSEANSNRQARRRIV